MKFVHITLLNREPITSELMRHFLALINHPFFEIAVVTLARSCLVLEWTWELRKKNGDN